MEGGVPCEESGRENATCLADRCLWHKLGLSVLVFRILYRGKVSQGTIAMGSSNENSVTRTFRNCFVTWRQKVNECTT